MFTILANDCTGSDTESVPDLGELLESSFDPDMPDNREEVRVQEKADSIGLDLRGLSLQVIFVGHPQRGFGVGDSHNQTLALVVVVVAAAAAAAAKMTLTPAPSNC